MVGELFLERSLDKLMNVLNPLIKDKSTGVSSSVDVKFPWKNPYLPREYGLQVSEGDKRMYEIARRFAKRFPEILDKFSIADLNFTASCTSRASQSATAFGLGYLQGKGHVTKERFQPIPITTYNQCSNDRLHRYQGSCQRWREKVLANPEIRSEYQKFNKSDKYQKIVRKVQDKLGLKGVKELDGNLVYLMFAACSWGVEKFGYSQNSRWCSLFSAEDQKVYDYLTDSYFYYLIGPGNQINIDASCFLLQDILTHLLSMAGKTPGSNSRKIVARFGHGNTVLPALYKLGLFLDKAPLLATNYEQMRDREFKVGKIAPMSGNFAFVLYKCSSYFGHKVYKIQFYHNERLVKLPACHSKIDCTLDEFVHYYKPLLDRCQWNQICN